MDRVQIESLHRHSPAFMHSLGIITMLFGIAAGSVCIQKLFDKHPGLVLNSTGLVENSSGLSVGFIPWSDITGFATSSTRAHKTLVVKVATPEKYIAMGGPLQRLFKWANYKMMGSPITIITSTLEVSFTELQALCNEYFERYTGTGKA